MSGARAHAALLPGIALRRSSWPVAIFGTCFALLAVLRYQAFTSDTFLSLVGGREVALHGLPRADHLTTIGAGRTWIDQQWLANWTFFRLWGVGGDAAVAAAAAALTALAYALLVALLLERGASPRRALKWGFLAFAVALPDTAVRAQAFAYPLFVGLVWLLLRDLGRAHSFRRLAGAVAILVLWANVHGSVLLGVALLFAYCAWRAFEGRGEGGNGPVVYGSCALLALLTPLATPYGLAIARYYEATLGNGAIRGFASEWQSAFAVPTGAIGFFALVAIVVLVTIQGVRRGVRPQPALVVSGAVLTAAGFGILRWEAWAAIPAVVAATDVLNRIQPSRGASSARAPRMAVLAGASVALVAAVGLAVERSGRYLQDVPTGAMSAVAARFVSADPSTTILADDVSSSALVWEHPELAGRLALDDRLEIFPTAALEEWKAFIVGRLSEARPLIARSDVLLASSSNRRLASELVRLRGWHVLYSDSAGIAVVRSTRSTADEP